MKIKKNNQILTVLFVLCLVLPIASVFATEEDSWVTLEPIPKAAASLGAAVVNGKMYAITGSVNYEYDPATDTWITRTSMPTARSNFGITVFENKIYVMGGDSSSGGPLGENEVYDPQTNSWKKKPRCPHGEWGCA